MICNDVMISHEILTHPFPRAETIQCAPNEIPLVNCIGSFLVTLGATNGRCNVAGMGMLSQKESLKACRFVSGLRKQRLAEPSNSLQLFQKALMARCLDGKEKIGTYRM